MTIIVIMVDGGVLIVVQTQMIYIFILVIMEINLDLFLHLIMKDMV